MLLAQRLIGTYCPLVLSNTRYGFVITLWGSE